MKNHTIYRSLQEYFKNTPKEKVLEDWNQFQHLDNEGITINEFLENQKQETLEDAAKDFIENTMKFSFISNDTKTQANRMLKCVEFGAKWKQEQNKNLYSEEDLLKFGAFVRIEDKKEKRLFLIQDYYKKWLEDYKNK